MPFYQVLKIPFLAHAPEFAHSLRSVHTAMKSQLAATLPGGQQTTLDAPVAPTFATVAQFSPLNTQLQFLLLFCRTQTGLATWLLSFLR